MIEFGIDFFGSRYSRTRLSYSRTHLAAGRFRSTSSGIRPNEVATSSGISPKSSEIKQPSYLEFDLIYGDGPAECAERLNKILVKTK